MSILCVGLLGCPADDDENGDSGSDDGGAGQSGSAGTGGNSGTGGSAGDAGAVDCECGRESYLPVCGVDGVSYDATCGRDCVPVEIACDGECPCPGASCGSVTCGVGERCCNHCDGSCVAMNARIACPDDADPDPACGS